MCSSSVFCQWGFFSVNLGIPPISGQTHVFLCSTCYVQNVVLRRFECALNGTNQPEELGPLEPRKSTRLFLAEMGWWLEHSQSASPAPWPKSGGAASIGQKRVPCTTLRFIRVRSSCISIGKL
jgi:hypothetical protein